jgi:flagellar export protein FliJ
MIFRFAGLLRARVTQESVEKAKVARMRFAANTALAEVHRQAASLDEAEKQNPSVAHALAGALVGRQAMAAELSATIAAARAADAVVDEAMVDLAVAARQRKAMDKLAERHALTRQRRLDAVERAEQDDLIAARHARARLGVKA